jgi:hypothetical protein
MDCGVVPPLGLLRCPLLVLFGNGKLPGISSCLLRNVKLSQTSAAPQSWLKSTVDCRTKTLKLSRRLRRTR